MTDLLLPPSRPEHREADRSTFFIEPAPLVDVLFDQLEYLVAHPGQECSRGCPECDRLEQIRKLLLVPFQSRKSPDRCVVA
jgi:hypothetical protein